MKNKKLIILFLLLLILLSPLEKAHGDSWWDKLASGISSFFNNSIVKFIGNMILEGVSYIFYGITWLFHTIISFLNINLFAGIVNKASGLNPFSTSTIATSTNVTSTKKAVSPAEAVWNVLKSYGFIILVFSALAVAYEWLLGDDASAKRLIFNIILVALIINFTFVLIKEAFLIAKGFEKGITNGQSNQIGTIMVGSLWQRDPFAEINQTTNSIQDPAQKSLTQAILYLFIVAFDLGITIILIVTLVLFYARYFYILALTAVSSIAVANLAFPEFKGNKVLAKIFANFHFFDEWATLFVKWLLIVPIFVTLVITCNVTKENILAQITGGELYQFIALFVGFTFCYTGSLAVAASLGGKIAAMTTGAVTGVLLAAGGLAAGGIMAAGSGAVGGGLAKIGAKLEEKVGAGGRFGWRSWVGQKIAKPIKETGEKMTKKKNEMHSEAAKGTIANIDKRTSEETDPTKIQSSATQIAQLAHQYKDNADVSKSIAESIRNMSQETGVKMLQQKEFFQMGNQPGASREVKKAIADLIKRVSPRDANKLMESQTFLEEAAGKQSSEEMKEASAELIDKLRKSDFRARMNDNKWVQNLQNLSQEAIDAIGERIERDFKEGDVVDFMSNPARIDAVKDRPELCDKLNSASKGFLEAVIQKNADEASNALSRLGRDFWKESGNSTKIHQILQEQPELQNKTEDIFLDAIGKSNEPKEILLAARREDPTNGPVRTMLRKLFRQPTVLNAQEGSTASPQQQKAAEIKKRLSPQDQATIDSIVNSP